LITSFIIFNLGINFNILDRIKQEKKKWYGICAKRIKEQGKIYPF